MPGMISTIITKPTKVCSADCVYCCAPPDGAPKWSLDEMRLFFDRIADHLTPKAVIIWHGGEPMLMGPDFYRYAYDYAQKKKPGIRFAMQSNLLGYDSKRWKDVFTEIMGCAISTSWDPDEENRLFRGSTKLYTRLFFEKLEQVQDDGVHPLVIGTYTEQTAPLAEMIYERATSGDRPFDLRFNYRYPAGRDSGQGESITPETYGRILVRLYDRWIRELPDMLITPLDLMLKKAAGIEAARCPWTKACGGHFMGVEPNMDVYNCSEFADLGLEQYRFGNLKTQTVTELLASPAARDIRRRRIDHPVECRSCRHFAQCEGGCARDAVLYDHGLNGKYHYCASWMMVFDRIKQSIASGEATAAIQKYGRDPNGQRQAVFSPPLPPDIVRAMEAA